MIFDCFPFFNELDLLEIRLRLLNETVDKFVLIESKRTFSLKKKKLYFFYKLKSFLSFFVINFCVKQEV